MKRLFLVMILAMLAGCAMGQTTNNGSLNDASIVVTNEQDRTALGTLASSGTLWRAEWQAAAGASGEVARIAATNLAALAAAGIYCTPAGTTGAALAVVAPYTNGATLGATAVQPAALSDFLPLAGGTLATPASIGYINPRLSVFSANYIQAPMYHYGDGVNSSVAWASFWVQGVGVVFSNRITDQTWTLPGLATATHQIFLGTSGDGSGLTNITAFQVGATPTNTYVQGTNSLWAATTNAITNAVQGIPAYTLPTYVLTNGEVSITYSNDMLWFHADRASITGLVFCIGGTNILLRRDN